MSHIVGLDHIQVAMPRGQEEVARAFYRDLLGLAELPKPAALATRGGLWFQCGEHQFHLGVEDAFAPARKAHPAFRVRAYGRLLQRLAENGFTIAVDNALPGVERAFVNDPFGNRVELVNADRDA
jgi:catechol 2,3-dioxygenase-like lactoylglutathione lyase family enzyme